MKYFLILFVFLSELCTAQIDISPSANMLAGKKMSDLMSFRISNYPVLKDSIGVRIMVVHDSAIIVDYSKRVLLDSNSSIFFVDSMIESTGYIDKQYWLRYHQNKYLSEGSYSIFYAVSTPLESDTFNINIHLGKPVLPKKKLIKPILNVGISSDYSFYDGQPPGPLNRDLNIAIKGGVAIKNIPLVVDVKFNTDYRNFGVDFTPAFLGFDESTFRGGMLQKAEGLIKDDKFSEQLNQNEFSHLQEDMVKIRELSSDSGLMAKLPLFKKLDSLKKVLSDTLHLAKDTSNSKQVDSSSGRSLQTKGIDSLVRHYQDSVSKSVKLFKKEVSVDSLRKIGLRFFGSDSSRKGDSSIALAADSLKKLYAKAAGYSKLIDLFNSIKKMLGGDISKLELINGKDSISGKLNGDMQKAKPLLQYANDPQKALNKDLTKKYIFNSSKFSKLEKIMYSIKTFKVGRFTNTGPNYFLGNSNLLGCKAEAEIKNVYCLLEYGKVQETRFTFNNFLSNRNALLVVGTGLHFNDNNFLHILFKRSQSVDTTNGENLRKFNYVFGQNSSVQPTKFLKIVVSTYVSSSSLVQDDLIATPATDKQVLGNLFNRNSDVTMWGFVNEGVVQAAITKKITLDYRSLLISSSYLSDGLSSISTNKNINEAGLSGNFLKDKLKLKVRYIRNQPLVSPDSYQSAVNQILTTTAYSFKKLQFNLMVNNLFYQKQISNLSSALTVKYTKQFKYSSYTNIVSGNYNVGFDSATHLQSNNYGIQYSFVGSIKQKNSFSLNYGYQYNIYSGQITDIHNVVAMYQYSLSKKSKIKFDGKFFFQQKNVKIAVNSYISFALSKQVSIDFKAGYGRYINSSNGLPNYDEYPLAFKLNYSL